MRDRIRPLFKSILTGCAAFAFLVVFGGCQSAQEVTSYVNPISGQRTDIVAQNLIDAPGNNREMLWLNAYRDFADRYHYKYYLEAIYGARQDVGYLDINPGRSLTIMADNQELTFSGLGSLSKKEEKGALFESARYEATADDMRTIANAKRVTVQLRGQNGVITREFASENFDKFRKFVQQADDENL